MRRCLLPLLALLTVLSTSLHADYDAAGKLYRDKHYPECLKQLKPLVAAGDLRAVLMVAAMQAKGEGMPADPVKAYVRAARVVEKATDSALRQKATGLLEKIKKLLSPQQLTQAQKLAANHGATAGSGSGHGSPSSVGSGSGHASDSGSGSGSAKGAGSGSETGSGSESGSGSGFDPGF